jgi:dolichol-phosphate mannosyltransferase
MKIAHIIPTYNEKENIGRMIDAIFLIGKKYSNWQNIIVVVDDLSPDGTQIIVKKYQKKYGNIFLLSKKKEGLGKALIMGYEYAIKNLKADIVIPNDADFQWDPNDYPKLVNRIEKGFDVVVASRHVKEGKVVGWSWFRKLNHDVSNYLLAWWIAGVREVHDHAGNFKAIRVKGILDKVPLKKMQNAGFSFQLHILYELSKTGAKFTEVGVLFKERKYGRSKIGFNKYYLRDVVEYIKSSIEIRLDRSKSLFKYLIVGGTGFTIQTVISKILVDANLGADNAVAIGAEFAIISNFILNNIWTFSHKRIQGIKLIWNFIIFNAVSIGSVIIQKIIVKIGINYYGEKSWFVFMVLSIIFIVIPYSYIIYNRFIWKTHIKKVY